MEVLLVVLSGDEDARHRKADAIRLHQF